MKKLKYRLSSLSCASCADKIERKLNTLDTINKASLNFINKEVSVEVNNQVNTNTLYDEINKVVQEIEDGVELCELTQTINYQVEGLDCPSCADKIEKTLLKTDGVLGATVDVMAKKITLAVSNQTSKQELFDATQNIIDRIEPGVKIYKQENQAKNKVEQKTHSMKKDLIIFFFGVALFTIAMVLPEGNLFHYILLIIAYFIIGGEVVYKAIRNIIHGKIFDEHFLMTIATGGAFLIGEHPEAVAVMMFYQVGEFFQEFAVNRSRRSIKSLMSIRPDIANIKQADDTVEMPVEDVQVGDMMIIKPGERIPLDGQIISGESTIDTKALTGESIPENVEEGDEVLSGCINLNGVLTVRVTKLASESTVSKVLELVENATSKKAPTENFITKFARVYTPIVTALAVIIAVVPPLLLESATFEEWIYRALIFLVISCPCALVVSIPLGFFGGIGAASRNGILVKGGNYLEALNSIEIAVFDKTGTLTEGTFTVTKVVTANGMTKEELLKRAAYAESYSNHPIALSVVDEYNELINQDLLSNVEEISGHGVKASYKEEQILVGNARLMNKEQITFDESNDLGSILYIAVDGTYVGHIVVSDKIKKDAKEAIKMLKSLGVKKTVMLTGDKKLVADSVGQELGIDLVYSELLPEDKLNKVEELMTQKSSNKKLFFVGDGINDTPVLARADIGIAMGGLGADAAIDVADVVIMNDEPSKIGTAVFVAKRTRKIVWQNIYLALGIKVIFMILGAVGIATMWEAVIGDVGVTLLAVFNAMRVLKYKYDM